MNHTADVLPRMREEVQGERREFIAKHEDGLRERPGNCPLCVKEKSIVKPKQWWWIPANKVQNKLSD
jgi:hypothetical protein